MSAQPASQWTSDSSLRHLQILRTDLKAWKDSTLSHTSHCSTLASSTGSCDEKSNGGKRTADTSPEWARRADTKRRKTTQTYGTVVRILPLGCSKNVGNRRRPICEYTGTSMDKGKRALKAICSPRSRLRGTCTRIAEISTTAYLHGNATTRDNKGVGSLAAMCLRKIPNALLEEEEEEMSTISQKTEQETDMANRTAEIYTALDRPFADFPHNSHFSILIRAHTTATLRSALLDDARSAATELRHRRRKCHEVSSSRDCTERLLNPRHWRSVLDAIARSERWEVEAKELFAVWADIVTEIAPRLETRARVAAYHRIVELESFSDELSSEVG